MVGVENIFYSEFIFDSSIIINYSKGFYGKEEFNLQSFYCISI